MGRKQKSQDNMNDRTVKTQPIEQEEMLPEYDFSSGVRGKHYKA